MWTGLLRLYMVVGTAVFVTAVLLYLTAIFFS